MGLLCPGIYSVSSNSPIKDAKNAILDSLSFALKADYMNVHCVPLTTSKMMQKKLLVVSGCSL